MPISIPQVRRLAFNGESVGMGFNSQSGLAVGSALEVFEVVPDEAAPGSEGFNDTNIVTTHDELMENLGMGFQAEGRYAFFQASAKAKFSASTNYNSTSTFVVCQQVISNAIRRARRIKVTEDAREILKRPEGTELFNRAFGDCFVRGLQTGGEFYCVARVTSVSTSLQEELAAKVRGGFQAGIAAAEIEGEFRKANTELHIRSEYRITVYQKSGRGAELAASVSIEDALAAFKRFAAVVGNSPAAYETEVATYDTLPLPLPTPEEQEAVLFALSDTREKRLRYLEKKNDLEFALEQPMFFVNVPVNEVRNAIGAYTRLINAVTQHWISISRGQTTNIFDPSALTPPLVEPAPIPLQRVPQSSEPDIPVRRLAGLDHNDIRFVLLNQLKTESQIVNHPYNPLGALFNWTQEKLEFFWSGIVFKCRLPDGSAFELADEPQRVEVGDQSPDSGFVAKGSTVILRFKRIG